MPTIPASFPPVTPTTERVFKIKCKGYLRGETISTATWSITPTIAQASDGTEDSSTTAYVTLGPDWEAGTEYVIGLTITDSAGQVLPEIRVPVRCMRSDETD